MKSCEGKISINFCGDKMPKEGSQCIYLLVLFIDSVFRTGKNYYPQVFLRRMQIMLLKKKSCLNTLLTS